AVVTDTVIIAHSRVATDVLPLVRAQLLLLFFFEGDGAHRDLHSFPTRRSSDLAVAPARRAEGDRADESRRPSVAKADTHDRRWRSEEHTSELQSRFDLVCRLLLEKKKKKNNYNTDIELQHERNKKDKYHQTQIT